MRALQENNEEEYFALLQETKNERLAVLLKQTDEFLEQIGQKVVQQKDRDDIEEMKQVGKI